MSRLLPFALAALLPACSLSPEESTIIGGLGELGAEVQVYPTGVITAVHAQAPLDEHSAAAIRVGHNRTERDDAGEHDDESGGGGGVGVGYRYWFEPGRSGWLIGGRMDIWSMIIDWTDRPGTRREQRGQTDMLVFQPTVEGGYSFRLGNSLKLDLVAAVGMELNAFVDGEEVGQGPIGLIGFNFNYVF